MSSAKIRFKVLQEARRQKARYEADADRRPSRRRPGASSDPRDPFSVANPFADDDEGGGNKMLIAMQQAAGSEGFTSRMAQLTPLVALSGRHQPRLQKAMLIGSGAEFAVYLARRGWGWWKGREERERLDQFVLFMRADSDLAREVMIATHRQTSSSAQAERALQVFMERAWKVRGSDGAWTPWVMDGPDDDEDDTVGDQDPRNERFLLSELTFRADQEIHTLQLTLPSGALVSVRQQFGKPGQEPPVRSGEGTPYRVQDWTDYLVLGVRGEDTLEELKSFLGSFFQPIPRRHHTPSSDLFVYTSKMSGWDLRSREMSRPLDSVTLRKGQAELILADIREFLKSERNYVEYGVTWRRGVLLYGEPGGGKTSFVRAMATSLGIDVYYLSLKTVTSNEALQDAVSRVDQRSIIVLEDVDVVAPTRDGQHSDDRVTLDVLLNVLDGMLTPHGAMFFMTTNDLDKLDPALVRPGRVDLRLEIVELDDYQVARMCQRFFGRDIGLPPVRRKIMPAELADVFKRYLRNREGAVDEVIALLS